MNLSVLSREALVEQFFITAACPLPDMHPLARDGTPYSLQPREGQLHQLLGLAKELLLRDLQRDLSEAPMMDRPQSLRDWLTLHFSGLDHEVFLVIFLDTQHRLLDAEVMFRGTLAQTTVYPREVVKAALARNAAAVAFAHNHPSGEPKPSRSDEALTATLRAALMLVDVRVIDHFVVAGNQFLSMAERGLL